MIPSLDEIIFELGELIDYNCYDEYTGLFTIKTKDQLIFIIDVTNPSDEFLLYFLEQVNKGLII